jgi:hypothetical protein
MRATSNWQNLNSDFLAKYQVVVFLDTRPEDPAQRAAFRSTWTMAEPGWASLCGLCFDAFGISGKSGIGTTTPFSGQVPTSATHGDLRRRFLRVEDRKHPATHHLPETFKSSPNEWYRWEKDLRQNPDIDILLSIDPTSFPLGYRTETG